MKKKFKLFKKKPRDLKYYKKEYIILQVEFLIMFAIFMAVLYFNFDYLMFKSIMSFGYYDTATLDDIYKEELNTDIKDNEYYKTFDDVAISLFVDRIYEKNNDEFTYLFLKGEFSNMRDVMKQDGEKTYVKALSPNTVYCKLTNFSSASKRIINDNIQSLTGYDYLILDLRDNSGGELKVADTIADLFLEKDIPIGSVKTRIKMFSKTSISKTDATLKYKHIYILQNENTASAAEVLANALIENMDNVTTVGTQSYGKGIGQIEYYLTNDYGFKATVMQLITPKGNSIHKVGITPDIEYSGEDIIDYVLGIIPK